MSAPSGLQVSYVRALQVLAAEFESDDCDRYCALDRAAEILRPALSETQQQLAPSRETAEKERQHRRERAWEQKIEREWKEHNLGGCPRARCGICGQYKAAPSDLCQGCGDDPVTHNGSRREHDRSVWGQ